MATGKWTFLKEEKPDELFKPSIFYGKKTENAREWLEETTAWFKYRNLAGLPKEIEVTAMEDGADKHTLEDHWKTIKRKTPNILALILKGAAGDWFNGLEEEQKETFEKFTKVFENRFLPSRHKCQLMRNVFDHKQEITESVDSYYDKHKRLASIAKMEPETIIETFQDGLLPHIRNNVFLKGSETLQQKLEDARIAEMAYEMMEEEQPAESRILENTMENEKSSNAAVEMIIRNDIQEQNLSEQGKIEKLIQPCFCSKHQQPIQHSTCSAQQQPILQRTCPIQQQYCTVQQQCIPTPYQIQQPVPHLIQQPSEQQNTSKEVIQQIQQVVQSIPTQQTTPYTAIQQKPKYENRQQVQQLVQQQTVKDKYINTIRDESQMVQNTNTGQQRKWKNNNQNKNNWTNGEQKNWRSQNPEAWQQNTGQNIQQQRNKEQKDSNLPFSSKENPQCKYCGIRHSVGRKYCRMNMDKTCKHCGKSGHNHRVCRTASW